MSEHESEGIFRDMTLDASIQEALERGNRAYGMLIKILDHLKTEVSYEKSGGTMSAADFFNKIIGLAHEYDLPEIREKALEYQEAGR